MIASTELDNCKRGVLFTTFMSRYKTFSYYAASEKRFFMHSSYHERVNIEWLLYTSSYQCSFVGHDTDRGERP
jgi:hypothetical protein